MVLFYTFFVLAGGSYSRLGITVDKGGDTKINKDIKPNGKDDTDSKKPCPDLNGGRPCNNCRATRSSSPMRDGTCSERGAHETPLLSLPSPFAILTGEAPGTIVL